MGSNSKFAGGAMPWIALALALATSACGSDDGGSEDGSGGVDATGGMGESGGVDATGGATGGSMSGGTQVTGGATTGGAAETGGTVATGCTDGWADADSGLCWEAEPTATPHTVAEATTYCEAFSAGGQDDFRLPTIAELRTLIRSCPSTEDGGSCPVGPSALDSSSYGTACEGCGASATCYWPAGLGGTCTLYWSASEVSDYPGQGAWFISFNSGAVSWEDPQTPFYVRCVRDL